MADEIYQRLVEWDMLIDKSFDIDISSNGITLRFWGPNYGKLDNQKLEILKRSHQLLNFHISNDEGISKLNVNLKSEDELFEVVKKVFLDNFDCTVENKNFELEVGFLYLSDFTWFKENIAYPQDLNEDESPICFISSRAPMGDWPTNTPYENMFYFRIKDVDKLVEMINQKNSQ